MPTSATKYVRDNRTMTKKTKLGTVIIHKQLEASC